MLEFLRSEHDGFLDIERLSGVPIALVILKVKTTAVENG